jgi:signal transduction histidine kinase
MRTLSLKLILAFLAVGLAGVSLLALFASRSTQNEFQRYVFDRGREELIDQLAAYYEERGHWDEIQDFHTWPQLPPPPSENSPGERAIRLSLTLLDQDRVVILAGRNTAAGQSIDPERLESAHPIEVQGELVGYLLLDEIDFARQNPIEEAFLQRVNTALRWSAGGAVVAALLLGVILARTLTRPIREMIGATRAVAAGDLEQTVAVRSRDELGELSRSFNLMSEQLSRARDARRQMTADIAHELRTPLSVILGHADALQEGAMPISMDVIEVIQSEALRLERLIDDLRLLSRAEMGELPLMMEDVALKPYLESILNAHRPLAAKKGISFALQLEKELPAVRFDPGRIGQVLANLIDNALRYTPQGGRVRLSATIDSNTLAFRLQDNGPGMEQEEQQQVFERFYRRDPSRQRASAGSGLGLAIARSIVESHQGRIWVQSIPGKGTTFAFTIPHNPDD